MKIKMLSSHRGSENAFSVRVYEKDWEGYIADTLASYFIKNGWAVAIYPEDIFNRSMDNFYKVFEGKANDATL